jgi:hypothetical protein
VACPKSNTSSQKTAQLKEERLRKFSYWLFIICQRLAPEDYRFRLRSQYKISQHPNFSISCYPNILLSIERGIRLP